MGARGVNTIQLFSAQISNWQGGVGVNNLLKCHVVYVFFWELLGLGVDLRQKIIKCILCLHVFFFFVMV